MEILEDQESADSEGTMEEEMGEGQELIDSEITLSTEEGLDLVQME